jgi:hypothetical protein
MSYSTKIINALEALWPKNVETQTDLIVQMLSDVPAEEHETVMQECAVFCVLSNSTNYMKDVIWGDVAVRADEAKANRFVTMPTSEWEHVKMLAKGDRWNRPWFASWAEWKQWADRINGKRRDVRYSSSPREVIARDPDVVKQLLEDREEVFRYPQMHVKTEAEAVALICELENAIVRHGGKARLDKVIDAEWDDAVAAGQVSEEQVSASKELARREDEYAEFPGLAAFIQSCGEPCRMVME